MINVEYLSQSCDVSPLVIPAPSSLTHKHADQIAEAVQASAQGWQIDRMDDCAGYLSVLVSAQDEEQDQPTYYISGTLKQIELAKYDGDTPSELGCFDTLQQAIDALVPLLNSSSVP